MCCKAVGRAIGGIALLLKNPVIKLPQICLIAGSILERNQTSKVIPSLLNKTTLVIYKSLKQGNIQLLNKLARCIAIFG